MDCDGQSLTQMGHKTLRLAKIQQYNSTKRLASREPYLNPLSDKGQSTLSRGKEKQETTSRKD